MGKPHCEIKTEPYCHKQTLKVPAHVEKSHCEWPKRNLKDDYRC